LILYGILTAYAFDIIDIITKFVLHPPYYSRTQKILASSYAALTFEDSCRHWRVGVSCRARCKPHFDAQQTTTYHVTRTNPYTDAGTDRTSLKFRSTEKNTFSYGKWQLESR